MTLKQLKRKYLAEGFKRGYKQVLKENIDSAHASMVSDIDRGALEGFIYSSAHDTVDYMTRKLGVAAEKYLADRTRNMNLADNLGEKVDDYVNILVRLLSQLQRSGIKVSKYTKKNLERLSNWNTI